MRTTGSLTLRCTASPALSEIRAALVVLAAIDGAVDPQAIVSERYLVAVEQEADLAARAERGDDHQRGNDAHQRRQTDCQPAHDPVERTAGGRERAAAIADLVCLGGHGNCE